MPGGRGYQLLATVQTNPCPAPLDFPTLVYSNRSLDMNKAHWTPLIYQ